MAILASLDVNTLASSKENTASIAPNGSTSIPSHLSMEETFLSSFACLKRGSITVGPVTINIAPITSDVVIDSPPTKYAQALPSTHAIKAPYITILLIVILVSLISSKLRDKLPSNKISATDRDIIDL